MYIVSKQEKDPGASITGSRLAVCDAATMKMKAEFATIGGADGRSFLGVDENTGYIGTSSGIYRFDIKNLAVGAQIAGTGTGTGLYDSQIGNMLRIGNRVFAVLQNKGILVIDALTHTLETTVIGKYGSIVMSKDGNLWASTDESANSGKTLVKINPFTLTTENFTLPDEAAIPNSWYAWTADGFCASKQTNSLYWKNNGGWFASTKIYKLDASNPTAAPVVVFDSSSTGWGIYGAGFRVNPLTDEIIVSMFKSFGDKNYKVTKLAADGSSLAEYPMEQNYWFPAIPVFPDNYAPTIDAQLKKISFKGKKIIYLGDKITDKDNFDAAIIKSITADNTILINASISGDSLILVSNGTTGVCKLTLSANSNGKIVSTDINVNVIDNPQIITQPQSQSVVVDENATFKVEATGGDLTYQWYKNDVAIASATSATYTLSSAKLTDNDAKIHCVVKNSLGEVTSDKVTLNTNLIVPEIKKQPVSLIKAEKDYGVSFSVTARGGNLTYQWYKNDAKINGATKYSYSISSSQVLKDKNGTYYCVVANGVGNITSDKVTLTVLTKVAITGQPVSLTIEKGKSATFTILATGDNLTYQWYKSTTPVELIEGATASTYSIDNIQERNNGTYYCIVTNEVSTAKTNVVELVATDPTGLDNTGLCAYSILPNPAISQISINTDGKVVIYSVNGVKVYENANYTSNIQINVSDWTKGMYFVKINGQTLKLIKQ